MSSTNYHDYLDLDKILNAQHPLSLEKGEMAHDEMLFISIHQSYEIWFKQVLFEIGHVLDVFKQGSVDETQMGSILHQIQRVVLILKNLVSQVDILETMTPLDFLEFRHLLYPASGFQSFQFRLLENRLGLKSKDRLSYNNQTYTEPLKKEQKPSIEASENEPNLFDCIQEWLERTPFLQDDPFGFWANYQKAVENIYEGEMAALLDNDQLSDESRDKMKAQTIAALESFRSLFNPEQFAKEQASGQWTMSLKAVRAALLISLYRDQPVFQLPFRLLTAAQDLDAQLTQWRYRHVLMVQRMLGKKLGTGGSSGASYLRQAAEQHRVFQDLYQLASFFVPRSQLPPLPKEAIQTLGFYYTSQK